MRARIVANLERYPVISGIVAALLLPGGFVLVPLIAWWHRRKRALEEALQGKPAAHRRKMAAPGRKQPFDRKPKP